MTILALLFAGNPLVPPDAATRHPYAFAMMAVPLLIIGVGKVAHGTNQAVKKGTSFIHFWMIVYLALSAVLMSITTAVALGLLYDGNDVPKLSIVPPSFLPLVAAVLGVVGFELIISKVVIGFGEKQLDFATPLQYLVDQAVASTLRKEVGG